MRISATTLIIITCLAAGFLIANTAIAQTTVINLADEGAECDGLTDDFDVIDEILTDLEFDDDDVEIVFPAGDVCFVSDSLLIQRAINFTFVGNGATLKFADSTINLLIKRSHSYTIENLVFDGSHGPCTQEPCEKKDVLILRGSTRPNHPNEPRGQILIRDVTVKNSGRAGLRLRGLGTNLTEDVLVDNLTALDNFVNGAAAGNVRNITFDGGLFADTGGQVLPSAGIDIESELGETTSDIEIKNGTFRDNWGAGVQIAASDTGGIPSDIRIKDGLFQSNERSAIRIKGIDIEIAGNVFEDFDQPSFDQDAAMQINSQSSTLLIDDNTFRNFTTGQRIIQAESDTFGSVDDLTISNNNFEDIEVGTELIFAKTGTTDVDVVDNHFDHINLLSGTGAAILHKSVGGRIENNTFHDLGDRGIWSTADDADITGNTFTCMRDNAIWAAGDNAQVDSNILGAPFQPGGTAANKAVIRSRGDGGSVNSNTVTCLGTAQRGIVIDNHPGTVMNNLVTNCDTVFWLQFLNGTGTTLVSGNSRATSTVNACVP